MIMDYVQAFNYIHLNIHISADENFYLQSNPSWLETNIWYKTTHVRRNKLDKFMQKIGLETQIDIPIKLCSNHSGIKTAT